MSTPPVQTTLLGVVTTWPSPSPELKALSFFLPGLERAEIVIKVYFFFSFLIWRILYAMWGTIQLEGETVFSFKTRTTQCVSNPLETSAKRIYPCKLKQKHQTRSAPETAFAPPSPACTQPFPHGKNLASRKAGLLFPLGKWHFFSSGILHWGARTRCFSGPFQTSLLRTNDSSCLNFHLFKFWKDLSYHLIGHYPSPSSAKLSLIDQRITKSITYSFAQLQVSLSTVQ